MDRDTLSLGIVFLVIALCILWYLASQGQLGITINWDTIKDWLNIKEY